MAAGRRRSIERAQYGVAAVAPATLAAERFHAGTPGQDVTRLYSAPSRFCRVEFADPASAIIPDVEPVRQPPRFATIA
jgi:hypothetical protein